MQEIMMDKLTIPRELSISKFNLRVVSEALSQKHNITEKLSFLSIYESNTKEFFEVRVGKLLNKYLASAGGGAENGYRDLFLAILEQERHNLTVFATAFDLIVHDLSRKRIHIIDCDSLTKIEEKAVLKELSKVPYSPMTVGKSDKIDVSQERYITLSETTTTGEYVWCELPRFSNFVFKREDGLYILPYEKAILKYINKLFGVSNIVETAILRIYHNHHFRVPEKVQTAFDYPLLLSQTLSKRRYQEVTKIDYCGVLTNETRKFILKKTGMVLPFIFERAFFDYGFISPIVKFLKESALVPQVQIPPLDNFYCVSRSLYATLKKRDVLISYPYESNELFNEFCRDMQGDRVESICASLYRVNPGSKLVDSLVLARARGVEVRVYIELLARGSEEDNIRLANYLEENGIEVKTGMVGYKVHSKLICVKRKTSKGETIYQTLVGTGNFNEQTMRLYTDFHLLTARKEVYDEAVAFFDFLFDGIEPTFDKLQVSGFNFKETFLSEVEKEIEFAKAGGETRIVLKCNGLNHPEVIYKLMEASKYMKVELFIRGICVIVPGIESFSKNMEVYSIVGKYLEHSRIYSFGEGKRNRTYIGSCDLMTRNIDKRYEVCIKVESKTIKAQLAKFLLYSEKDTLNKHQLRANKSYIKAKTPPVSDSFKNQYALLKRKVEQKRIARATRIAKVAKVKKEAKKG